MLDVLLKIFQIYGIKEVRGNNETAKDRNSGTG